LTNSRLQIAAFWAFVGFAGLSCGFVACSAGQEPEAAALPSKLHADYLVFAQRCSKCHSLARPLNSGIDSDEYWKLYVERMRRQPASGISVADTVPILRFLHVYSIEQRKKKDLLLGEQPKTPPAPTTPLAPGLATPDAATLPVNGQH
jgi:hypothetical protein